MVQRVQATYRDGVLEPCIEMGFWSLRSRSILRKGMW